MVSKPENFSWLDEFIAGSAKPQTLEHLKFYVSDGIGKVISLNVERPLVMYDKENVNIADVHLPVFSTPSENTLRKYREELRESMLKGEKVVIHCQFGQERTGQMLAIYLMEFKRMRWKEAFDYLRSIRPTSLGTQGAINFLKNHYD